MNHSTGRPRLRSCQPTGQATLGLVWAGPCFVPLPRLSAAPVDDAAERAYAAGETKIWAAPRLSLCLACRGGEMPAADGRGRHAGQGTQGECVPGTGDLSVADQFAVGHFGGNACRPGCRHR
jgi:hypothetical protein